MIYPVDSDIQPLNNPGSRERFSEVCRKISDNRRTQTVKTPSTGMRGSEARLVLLLLLLIGRGSGVDFLSQSPSVETQTRVPFGTQIACVAGGISRASAFVLVAKP